MCGEKNHHGGRDPTSYHMHDLNIIFKVLNLKEGDIFLDLGCGTGDYSIHASKIIGKTGKVYAIDKWESVINNLAEIIKSLEIENISVKVSDISQPLDIKDNCVDICFIATVLHSLNLTNVGKNLFHEIHRVLKLNGRLIIIECNIKDISRGPPIEMRISPDKLEKLALQCGFEKSDFIDLGFNYLMEFKKSTTSAVQE
ncbi:MAG: methyltransferase domain-containing protein [Promethearchaeota archaeon]|nr:MAG: methyltransferase domain-containing protein [Candidatus Lokiarchaeota archaeon]